MKEKERLELLEVKQARQWINIGLGSIAGINAAGISYDP